MTIRAVIWDLGGVLLRTEDYTSRQRQAARLGLTLAELEHLVFSDTSGNRAQRGEIQAEQHWKNVLEKLDIPLDQLGDFQDEFWAGDRLDTRLVDYIRSLRGPYRTGLLSNAFSDLREFVTQQWGFADAFDELIISSEVGLVKPDPRIYRLALERLGVDAAEAVFLDDFSRNVEGARAVGLHAIHFVNPAQALADLNQVLNQDHPQ